MPKTCTDSLMTIQRCSRRLAELFPHMDDDTLLKASRSIYFKAIYERNRLRAYDILTINPRATETDVGIVCDRRHWAMKSVVQKVVRRTQADTPAGVATHSGVTTRRSEPQVTVKNGINLMLREVTMTNTKSPLLSALIASQNWPFLQAKQRVEFENGKTGRGVVTLCPVEKGSIVCDYHGLRVSYSNSLKF